jgi:hypothetical protein
MKIAKCGNIIKLQLSNNDHFKIGKQAGWVKTATIRSYIKSFMYNDKELYSLCIMTDDYSADAAKFIELKDRVLKPNGFKYFKPDGTWSKIINSTSDDVLNSIENALSELGVDVGELRRFRSGGIQNPEPKPITTEPTLTNESPVPQPDDASKQAEQQATETTVDSLNEELQQEMGDRDPSDDKYWNEFMEKAMSKLANLTDEASKGNFVKGFLKFASKLYNYSYFNSFLIYWQSLGRATYVASTTDWKKMGRNISYTLKYRDIPKQETTKPTPLNIFVPVQVNQKAKDGTPILDLEDNNVTFLRYVVKPVYDISDTEPIPSWKDATTGEPPFEPSQWRSISNEPVEEVNDLINAAKEWAAVMGINIKQAEVDGGSAGYSTGREVVYSDKTDGLNALAVIIHELAHSLLHWQLSEMIKKEKEQNGETYDFGERVQKARELKEIEAESTSWIVLEHYGYNHIDAPNYLGIWQLRTSDPLLSVKNSVGKVSREIIQGIDSFYSQKHGKPFNPSLKKKTEGIKTAYLNYLIKIAMNKKRREFCSDSRLLED